VAVLGILLLGIAVTASGQQASTVLDVLPGVQLLGAGGAGQSISSGAETLYHNPANLSQLPGISFSSFYASHMALANYSAASLTVRNWGLALLTLGSSGIDGYDADGLPTGAIAYRNTGVLLGVGFDASSIPLLPRLPVDLAVGARFKYVSSRIAEERGSGSSLDVGLQVGLGGLQVGPIALSDTGVGLTAVNLLGGVSYDAEQDPFMTELQIGFSTWVARMARVAVDLHTSGSSHLGVTYAAAPTLDHRLGLISRDGIRFTFGVGINLEGVLIDYAFLSHSVGSTHRVALTLDFSRIDVAALRNMFRRILP